MVNTRKKGLRKELLCATELKRDGWIVVFRSTTVKRGPLYVGLDFADLIDVVAIKGKIWFFISCKHSTSGDIAKDRQKLLEFVKQHADPDIMWFQMWIWHKARFTGRGKDRKWTEAHWEQQVIK